MSSHDPSAAYLLVAKAMEQRRQLACLYQDRRRELCPVVLGWSDGREKLLAYQLGGESSRPLTTPETRWRCLFLDDTSELSLASGWPEIAAMHRAGQSCVRDVDLDINPDSPFAPRRRLGWQR